jgi:hypothetical protein
VFLAEVAVSSKVLKGLLVGVVTGPVKDSLESLYRRVSETAVYTL